MFKHNKNIASIKLMPIFDYFMLFCLIVILYINLIGNPIKGNVYKVIFKIESSSKYLIVVRTKFLCFYRTKFYISNNQNDNYHILNTKLQQHYLILDNFNKLIKNKFLKYDVIFQKSYDTITSFVFIDVGKNKVRSYSFEQWKSKTSRKYNFFHYFKIDINSTLEDVRKEYIRLSKIYHPDNIKTGCNSRMTEINEMYQEARTYYGK